MLKGRGTYNQADPPVFALAVGNLSGFGLTSHYFNITNDPNEAAMASRNGSSIPTTKGSIASASAPATTSATTGSSQKSHVAPTTTSVALGVGLGLGLPIIALMAAILLFLVRGQRMSRTQKVPRSQRIPSEGPSIDVRCEQGDGGPHELDVDRLPTELDPGPYDGKRVVEAPDANQEALASPLTTNLRSFTRTFTARES